MKTKIWFPKLSLAVETKLHVTLAVWIFGALIAIADPKTRVLNVQMQNRQY